MPLTKYRCAKEKIRIGGNAMRAAIAIKS